MARARKGGDPGAKRFQATLATLKRTRPPSEEPADPEAEPAAVPADRPKAKRPKKNQAKTKLR